MTMAHFMVYGLVSKSAAKKSTFFTTQLLAVGLLTEAEKVALDASPSKKTTLILWLSQLFNHKDVAAKIPLPIRLRVMSRIIVMKDHMADLQMLIESYPPLSWAQVMQVCGSTEKTKRNCGCLVIVFERRYLRLGPGTAITIMMLCAPVCVFGMLLFWVSLLRFCCCAGGGIDSCSREAQ